MRERVRLLEVELGKYTNEHFRVCIFGSARIEPEDEIYKTTERLAFLLGEQGIDVLTGGGPGLMEAGNKGLHEGSKRAGSHSWSYGISIDLGKLEPLNEHLDVKHHHKKFSSRLDDFMRLSHAIVVNPGGIGTLLELYFSWQLLQVRHMPKRPVILLNRVFWEGLIDWMNDKQVAGGLVCPEDMDFIHIVDTPEEAMEILGDEFQNFKKKVLNEKQQIKDSKSKRHQKRKGSEDGN
jgi:hypothetical protein